MCVQTTAGNSASSPWTRPSLIDITAKYAYQRTACGCERNVICALTTRRPLNERNPAASLGQDVITSHSRHFSIATVEGRSSPALGVNLSVESGLWITTNVDGPSSGETFPINPSAILQATQECPRRTMRTLVTPMMGITCRLSSNVPQHFRCMRS
jgi:hypothetical protein